MRAARAGAIVEHMASADVSTEEFRALFRAVRRWGGDDARGALRHLTAERVVSAAGLVREGISVTLALPLGTRAAGDCPEPAEHRMTLLADTDVGAGAVRFVKDYVGVDFHNDGHSHIDALCHVAYEGRLFNGVPQGSVTAEGASADTIELLKDGLVGRGVLLDVPRLRGVPWLEPGDAVGREDLEGAERAQGVTVAEGDILLVRTGHARRLAELGPWDTTSAKAACTPPPRRSSPSAASPRWAPTATATRRRAPRRASASPSTCWRSTRWASTSSTTSSSRTCARSASASGAGSSSSPPSRCGSSAGPARR